MAPPKKPSSMCLLCLPVRISTPTLSSPRMFGTLTCRMELSEAIQLLSEVRFHPQFHVTSTVSQPAPRKSEVPEQSKQSQPR